MVTGRAGRRRLVLQAEQYRKRDDKAKLAAITARIAEIDKYWADPAAVIEKATNRFPPYSQERYTVLTQLAEIFAQHDEEKEYRTVMTLIAAIKQHGIEKPAVLTAAHDGTQVDASSSTDDPRYLPPLPGLRTSSEGHAITPNREKIPEPAAARPEVQQQGYFLTIHPALDSFTTDERSGLKKTKLGIIQVLLNLEGPRVTGWADAGWSDCGIAHHIGPVSGTMANGRIHLAVPGPVQSRTITRPAPAAERVYSQTLTLTGTRNATDESYTGTVDTLPGRTFVMQRRTLEDVAAVRDYDSWRQGLDYVVKGDALIREHKYAKAAEQYCLAKYAAEGLHRYAKQHFSILLLCDLANCYYSCGQFGTAEKLYDQARSLAVASKDIWNERLILNNAILNLEAQNKVDQADKLRAQEKLTVSQRLRKGAPQIRWPDLQRFF